MGRNIVARDMEGNRAKDICQDPARKSATEKDAKVLDMNSTVIQKSQRLLALSFIFLIGISLAPHMPVALDGARRACHLY